MLDYNIAIPGLFYTGIVAPLILVFFLGFSLIRKPIVSEHGVAVCIRTILIISLSCFLLVSLLFLSSGSGPMMINFGSLFALEKAVFQFDFYIDALSVLFANMTIIILAIVAEFSFRYLEGESGFHRYFFVFSIFLLGMLLVTTAGSIEVLFTGWECIGISSTLLVSFFHSRESTLKNAIHVYSIYRLGDAALMASSVMLHHFIGSGSLGFFNQQGYVLTSAQATIVGFLLLVAVAAKCAQLPFSTWLPRAMEGPTPSSAVFYGALSVHAGAYLLLRSETIWQNSIIVHVLLFLMGAFTAFYASIVGKAQSDIKSVLSFASMTQVGIILCEIALGLNVLAVIHIVGHSFLRLLQFLRAPSLLQDIHQIESVVGSVTTNPFESGYFFKIIKTIFPNTTYDTLYLWALERGYLERIGFSVIISPVRNLVRSVHRAETKLIDYISEAR